MSSQRTWWIYVRRHLGAFLSICLAIFFLFLAVRGIDWNEVEHTLLHVQVIYLFFGFCIFSISLLLRSLRWRTLLSARISVPPNIMFWTTAIGYLGNTVLPARAGEVIRSVVLGNKAGVSKSFVFATALTERVLDACVLVVTAVLLLPALGHLPEQLKTFLWIITPLSLLAFGLVAFAPALWQLFAANMARAFALVNVHLPEKTMAKIFAVAEQYSLGAAAFVHPLRAMVFFFFTASIWILDGCGAVIMAYSMGLTIQLPQAILFLIALALASALPSTPGYVGLYQITAVTILPGFGFTRSLALAYIFIMQFVNVMSVLIWGLIGLFKLDIKLAPEKEEVEV